jgi:hypothetical protein
MFVPRGAAYWEGYIITGTSEVNVVTPKSIAGVLVSEFTMVDIGGKIGSETCDTGEGEVEVVEGE